MALEEKINLPLRPSWFVYMVRCCDGSYYTGITTDLVRRMAEHNSPGDGAKYTRPRRPVALVYCEAAQSRSMASQREHRIKKMKPLGKTRLIAKYTAEANSLHQPDEMAEHVTL
jgi:putative endonuclease